MRKATHFEAYYQIFRIFAGDETNTLKLIKMKNILCILFCVVVTIPTMAQNAFAHPWQGKRVAYFGDSITDPNNKASKKKYWTFLQEWLGITPYVYAKSGRQWNDIPRQTDQLQKEHGNDVDAILIMIGTNDYNAGVPIGQWYTERAEKVMVGIHEEKHYEIRHRQYLSMTDSTYRGRINKAMLQLKQKYSTTQIVLMTPIHRAAFYANDKNWQPTEDYRNLCGEYLKSYVDAVKEAGNIWAVPVIDLNSLCGLYPMLDEHAQYFNKADTDRLHPNDKGHERMARTLMHQLWSLPCTF